MKWNEDRQKPSHSYLIFLGGAKQPFTEDCSTWLLLGDGAEYSSSMDYTLSTTIHHREQQDKNKILGNLKCSCAGVKKVYSGFFETKGDTL